MQVNASVGTKGSALNLSVNTSLNTNNLNQFKPGEKLDWQVRVHVIEARDLNPRDANGMSDPVTFVTVLNKKKHTITHHKTVNCTWDHLMFFEFPSVTSEELFLGKIKLVVFDANTITRNVEIGTAEIDLAYIYNQPNHELFRTWVAITDKSGKYNGIQGYLRLSAVVLGPKDEAPAHEESEEADETGDSLQSMILLPPSIKTSETSLELSIIRAEGLPKMDTFGKCDGYVAASFGGSAEISTEIIKKEFNPTWLERLCIPVSMPTMADLIKLQVRDHDQGSQDEIVGTSYLRFSDITTNRVNWKNPRWVNFYGIPDVTINPGKETEIAKSMNEALTPGTAFRGRVLVAMDIHAGKDLKLTKTKINNLPEPATDKYLLRFDAFEATELQTKSDVSIEISIGVASKECKKTKVENGNAVWYSSIEDAILVLPQDKTQVPDVFINIYQHALATKKRLGYIRIKATEITNNKIPTWSPIVADEFGSADKATAAGFLQYRLELGTERELGARGSVAKPTFKKYQLRAHLYQGRELPSGDKDGMSDPYCIVRVGKFSKKTKIIKSTLFPTWYETLSFSVELPERLEDAPEVHVQVWDYDVADPDDFLGRFSIAPRLIKETMIETPQWYSLYSKDPSITEGAILASFQLIPEEKASSYPVPDLTPVFKDCVLDISAVGLRDLLPFALIPAKKPLIEFDCGGEAKIRTKPSDTPNGTNANFLENLKLSVKIPEKKVFCPPINIRVYDDRVIHKPLIATRALPITPFIPWFDKDEKDLEILKENITTKVEKIPGAPILNNEEKPVTSDIQVVVDSRYSDNLKLLQNENQDINTVQDAVLSSVTARTLPNVAESFMEGAEQEKVTNSAEREVLKYELEHDMSEPPFLTYKLFRAKKKDGRPVLIEAGEFKGRFKVLEADKKDEAPINLKELYKPTEYIVRIYVLEAFQLVPKDIDGNNPYIRVTNGKIKIKDVDDKKQKTSRPQFYKVYEVPCVFPVQTVIDLSIWDWDPVTDELIGSTRIDLENRFHSNQWKNMKKKPIEYRTLWNPSSSNAQGQVKLWIDILTPEEAKSQPPEDIKPPVATGYELRVIVWETRKVALKDKDGKSSDIFIVGYPEGVEPQPTETHWKCEDGNGTFNWRLKFPLTLPSPTTTFKLQVWDRNVINVDAVICEANINLRSFYNKAIKKKSSREILPKQWVAMTHPTHSGVQGEVLVSLELLTFEEAHRSPAGFGREEPNLNPTLPAPVRPETSFAPWNVSKQVEQGVKGMKFWWGGFRIKLYIGLACLVILAILVVILWFSRIF